MTDFIKVSTPQTGRLLQQAGARILRAARQALRQEAETIMAESKDTYVPVDMGTLKSAGFVKGVEQSGTMLSVTLGYGGAAKGYALFVHEGTGPAVGRPAFFPSRMMIDMIAAWAKRHGIDEGAAYAIARNIGKRGLAPIKYLEKPLNAARRGMDQRLADRIKRTAGA